MANFRNRIIRNKNEKVETLLSMMHPMNWKIHTLVQTKMIKGSLSEVGWIDSVIINQRSSEEFGDEKNKPKIINGHLRVKTCYDLDPQMEIPVDYVDLLPNEEALILAIFDPMANLAEMDTSVFVELNKMIESEDQDLLTGLLKIAEMYDIDLDFKFQEFEESVSKPIPEQEWKGMPEFSNPDATPPITLKVHFRNEKDYFEFSKLVDQKLTLNTKYIFYPKQERENLLSFNCKDES